LQRTVRAVALVVACLAGSCQASDAPTVEVQPKSGAAVRVVVEIADTPEARTRGLMYRKDLGADRGMLFLFEHDGDWQFWMKNTLLSLDMIWLSSDGRIVGIVADTEPLSLRSVGPGVPARAVLEVNAGFARKHGIATGDRVVYRNVRSKKLP
jgi:hypothetical protein